MSETTQNDRDERTGRFVAGNSGNGGRRRGARSKLGEAYLEDLRDAWNELGAQALRQCAEQEPGTFCKIIASLLPKTIDLNIAVDATAFADRFRTASELLGNEPSPRLRKPLPGQPRVIEHDNGR
jgi:hypothetical protein